MLAAAEKDEKFLSLLRTDPRAAIEQVVGTALPEALQVRVVQETPDVMYLVLPTHLIGHDRDVFHSLTGRPMPRE